MVVTVSDIADIFPRPFEPEEEVRAEGLIQAALDLIEEEFLRRSRDFYRELESNRLLTLTAKRVIRSMISEAVLVGDNIGRQSASSTTGPQSDSITWSQGVGIHWGSVYMTDKWLRDLGLGSRGGTKGQFGKVTPFGRLA